MDEAGGVGLTRVAVAAASLSSLPGLLSFPVPARHPLLDLQSLTWNMIIKFTCVSWWATYLFPTSIDTLATRSPTNHIGAVPAMPLP